ncbi:MAG: hypothetical protein M3373_06440 [Gemmatimonadota bacterium]|nr:hypothetical protein [Gemmatimonadota bacterium]
MASLIHRPALAILDEPFTGLDPLSQEFFLSLVSELREAGTTIILSAHQMDLVERSRSRAPHEQGTRDPLRLRRGASRPARRSPTRSAHARGQ